MPIFQLDAGAPAFADVVDFSVLPVQRHANGSGLDVVDGVVFMAGTAAYGAGYHDNGTSADGGLYIGRYALFLDDAGVPPTVTVTAPATGSSFPERTVVLLTADARDDVAVDSVDFVVGGQQVARVFRPPFQVKYALPVGVPSVTITAVAHDTGGNSTTSDPVTVTVTPNPAPVVRLLTPARRERGDRFAARAGGHGDQPAGGGPCRLPGQRHGGGERSRTAPYPGDVLTCLPGCRNWR